MSGNIMEQPGDPLPVQVTSGYEDHPNNDIKVCGILSYGNGKPREVRRFKKNCYELQSALRIGATNGERIIIVDKDNIQSAFISHLLQWENEMFTAAAGSCVREGTSTFPIETTYDIVQHIYWLLKRINAYSNICRRLKALRSPYILPQPEQVDETQYVYAIVRSVEQRWRRVTEDKEISDEKAPLLSALTSLYAPIVDCFAERSGQRIAVHKIIGELQLDERLKISKDHPFNETTRVDADNYFKEWVYSRGICLTGDKSLDNLMTTLQNELTEEFGIVPPELIKSVVRHLRRLDDRTFWFHFSGHHFSDGIQCNDTTIPLLQDILQAAGYALSNIVVTFDCSHADALVKNFRFAVDGYTEYSGLTVISSSSSEYKSPINSCFTSLLATALCSAAFTCLRPANNPCEDSCAQQEAECSVCKRYSEKCKENGTISINKIFRFIRDHLQPDRKPTIRRHYAKSQLPVARYNNTIVIYRITFVAPKVCDKCCNLVLKVVEKNKLSLKQVRKKAFLRLLQLSHTTCMNHCEAIGKARMLACRLVSYTFRESEEDYLKQHSVENSCNCVTLVQGMMRDPHSSYVENFTVRGFNKPSLEFKRISMLLFNMTFFKQNESSKDRKITNNEQFMMALPDGILLEVSSEDMCVNR